MQVSLSFLGNLHGQYLSHLGFSHNEKLSITIHLLKISSYIGRKLCFFMI